MKIYVTVDPRLLQYISHSLRPADAGEWEVKEGTTVAEFVIMLNFLEGTEIFTIVNGVCCLDMNRPIREGDSVALLPLIAGG